jgi:hypothetical protein
MKKIYKRLLTKAVKLYDPQAQITIPKTAPKIGPNPNSQDDAFFNRNKEKDHLRELFLTEPLVNIVLGGKLKNTKFLTRSKHRENCFVG